jgi:hypothetical protein
VALAGIAIACVPDLGGFSGGPDDAAAMEGTIDAPEQPPGTPDADAADAGGADGDAAPCIPSRVQMAHQVDKADASTPSYKVVLAATDQRAGDFLVVGVNYDPVGCGQIAEVSDTAGDHFTRLVLPDGLPLALTLETWGAANVAAAPRQSNAVTVTFASACKIRNVKIAEYTGIDPVTPIDAYASTHGTSIAPSASVTTTHPSMLFAHSADQAAATSPGMGWTLLFIDDWYTLAEERVAAPGTNAVSYANDKSENWVLQAVALRSACP